MYFAAMNSKWYPNRWVAFSLHVLFWALFFFSPYLLRPVFNDESRRPVAGGSSGFFTLLFINNILRLVLFYANAFWLIPRLFYKRKHIEYIAVTLAALAV